MKLVQQLWEAYQNYKALFRQKPDLLIVDKEYCCHLVEEREKVPDFLSGVTVIVVPRMGKSEGRFYKKLDQFIL